MTYILDEQGRELLRPNTTAGVLMGRGTGSAGFLEQITLASGLYMSGTTLYSTGGGSSGASISTTSGKIVGRSSGTGTPVDVTIGSGIGWAGDAIYSLAASGSSINLTSGSLAGRSSGTGSPVVVTLSSGLAWNGDAIAVTAVSGFIGNSGKVQGRSSGTGTPINVNIGSGLGWAGDDLYATNSALSVTSGTIAARSSGAGSPVSVTLSSGLGWDGDSIYATNAPTSLNSGKVAGRSSGDGTPVNIALSSGLYWDGDAIAVNAISGLQATSGKVQGRSSGTGIPINVVIGSGLGWVGDDLYSTVATLSITSGTVAGRSSGAGVPVSVNLGSGLGWAGDAIYSTVAGGSVTLNSGTIAGRSSGTGASVGVTLSSGLAWDGDSIHQTYRDVRFHVGGRLTVVSGSPVIAGSGFSGATEIHWQPFVDNQISLYDVNSGWQIISVPTATLALGTLLSGKPYDIFGILSGGGLYLESNAWSGDVLRNNPIGYQDGVPVKSGDPTRRLLGTFYTTTTTTTASTLDRRYVANLYNLVGNRLFTCPAYVNNNSNTTYTVSNTTWAEVNATSGAKVNFVCPLGNWPVFLALTGFSNLAAAGGAIEFGIGLDSTTSPSVAVAHGLTATCSITANLPTDVTNGKHFASFLAVRANQNATVFADIARLGANEDPATSYLTGVINQ